MCNWLFCLVGINTSSESSKIESCESFESTCPTTFRTQISNLNFFFWCRVFNEKKNIRVLFSDGCFFFLSSFCSSKWDYFSKWVGFWNQKSSHGNRELPVLLVAPIRVASSSPRCDSKKRKGDAFFRGVCRVFFKNLPVRKSNS